MGETYLSVLVAPIPRSVWPDKPVSLAAQLGFMMRFGGAKFNVPDWIDYTNQFSLSPGFIGESYANFGILGVFFLSIAVGCSMAKIDRSMRFERINDGAIPWLPLLPLFILIHRGDFYTASSFSIHAVIGLLIFRALFYEQLRSEDSPSFRLR